MSIRSPVPLAAVALIVLAAAGNWAAAQQPPLVEAAGHALARWQSPVCPLVSGLPQEQGEFILARVTEIGREAGVPLAHEHCRANLYVLVTPDPEGLLRGMGRRNWKFTFGYEPPPPAAVDMFITTARPVRVWYDTYPQTSWGLPVERRFPMEQGSIYVIGIPTSELTLKSVVSNVIYRVFVVVDRASLKGVSLGQLADYVAMAGLGQLKPNTRIGGDGQSILALFSETPQSAPAGITESDRAFLKSLYVIGRAPNGMAASPDSFGGIER